MRKYLMALAATALLASQAAAATISGPTTVNAGQTYTYIYSPDMPYLTPGYLSYEVNMAVNDTGNPADDVWSTYAGTTYPASNQFSFDWVFDATGPATLTVYSVIVTFFGNEFVFTDELPFWVKEDGTIFRGENIDAVSMKISVVPIGGTLPLLLSALGALGWMARRRKAEAALPA